MQLDKPLPALPVTHLHNIPTLESEPQATSSRGEVLPGGFERLQAIRHPESFETDDSLEPIKYNPEDHVQQMDANRMTSNGMGTYQSIAQDNPFRDDDDFYDRIGPTLFPSPARRQAHVPNSGTVDPISVLNNAHNRRRANTVAASGSPLPLRAFGEQQFQQFPHQQFPHQQFPQQAVFPQPWQNTNQLYGPGVYLPPPAFTSADGRIQMSAEAVRYFSNQLHNTQLAAQHAAQDAARRMNTAPAGDTISPLRNAFQQTSYLANPNLQVSNEPRPQIVGYNPDTAHQVPRDFHLADPPPGRRARAETRTSPTRPILKSPARDRNYSDAHEPLGESQRRVNFDLRLRQSEGGVIPSGHTSAVHRSDLFEIGPPRSYTVQGGNIAPHPANIFYMARRPSQMAYVSSDDHETTGPDHDEDFSEQQTRQRNAQVTVEPESLQRGASLDQTYEPTVETTVQASYSQRAPNVDAAGPPSITNDPAYDSLLDDMVTTTIEDPGPQDFPRPTRTSSLHAATQQVYETGENHRSLLHYAGGLNHATNPKLVGPKGIVSRGDEQPRHVSGQKPKPNALQVLAGKLRRRASHKTTAQKHSPGHSQRSGNMRWSKEQQIRGEESESMVYPAVSVAPAKQMKMLANAEFQLCMVANDFLMRQKEGNKMSLDSVQRITKQWHNKNRPQVQEFMYDLSTQYDLTTLNADDFQFHGPRSQENLAVVSALNSWKDLARNLSTRTFCAPDQQLKKIVRDAFRVLELLGAGAEQFLTLSEMQKGIDEAIERAARDRAVGRMAHGRTRKVDSPQLISTRGIVDDEDQYYHDGIYRG